MEQPWTLFGIESQSQLAHRKTNPNGKTESARANSRKMSQTCVKLSKRNELNIAAYAESAMESDDAGEESPY